MCVTENLEALALLEQSIAKSTNNFQPLRKRADDIYEKRVAEIANEQSVSLSNAHGLAASDPIAKRAYATSVELAERHSKAIKGGKGAAAYISG
jgi:hypothetical protein